jgi:DNA-binding GntR family transcriptional regulator
LTLVRYSGRVSAEPLPSLDRSTLRERALQSLRAAITSGRYRPGDHLGEVDLASLLGVSRGTVREALRHLQQEGLITAGNRGMLRVNSVTPQEIRELFRVRAALEGLAVTEIIASPQHDAAVATLRTALTKLPDTPDNFAENLEADLGFHLLLCQLSGNSMLVESWRHLEGRIRVTIMNGETADRPTMMARDRHAPIVEAIAGGDVAAAVTVVEQHMAAAARQYAPLDAEG